MYVLVLVILDLLTALVVMPFMCSSGISVRWDFSDFLCQLQAYSCVVLPVVCPDKMLSIRSAIWVAIVGDFFTEEIKACVRLSSKSDFCSVSELA